MTTLMQWGNSEGIQGRCDDKCHSAKDPVCKCMCGGRFHGANNQAGGLEKAVEEYQQEVINYANKRLKEEGYELQINNMAQFIEIFEMKRNQYSFFDAMGVH